MIIVRSAGERFNGQHKVVWGGYNTGGKGPEFPDGIAYSPNMIKARKVREEFFKEHALDLCMDKNPPPSTLLSVPSLAFRDMLIEITVIAALAD